MITVYLYARNKNYIISLIPGMFYSFIISTFIINAKIGLNVPINIAYVCGIIFTILWAIFTLSCAKKLKLKMENKLNDGVSNSVTQ